MNPWWLLLIVPVAMYFGMVVAGLLFFAKSEEAPRD
jgi:hypothetical protein